MWIGWLRGFYPTGARPLVGLGWKVLFLDRQGLHGSCVLGDLAATQAGALLEGFSSDRWGLRTVLVGDFLQEEELRALVKDKLPCFRRFYCRLRWTARHAWQDGEGTGRIRRGPWLRKVSRMIAIHNASGRNGSAKCAPSCRAPAFDS